MKRALGAAPLTLVCGLAFASPAETVILPDVSAGEHEIELELGTERDNGRRNADALTLSFGTGVTAWWATELGVELGRERDGHVRYDGIEWENRFRLLDEEDEAPIGLSLLASVERPREREEGWSATAGLLSQKKLGRFLLNANLLVERTWAAEAGENGTHLGYQWQLKYRHAPRLHYGLQGMGEVGKWNEWDRRDDQQHRLGPAIFGRVPLDEGQRLKYDVGLLFGLTQATPDHTLRMMLEYEFR